MSMKIALALVGLSIAIVFSINAVNAEEVIVNIEPDASLQGMKCVGEGASSNLCFNPGILTVNKGTTVTWVNLDNLAHTVTSGFSYVDQSAPAEMRGPDGRFDSGLISPGGKFSYTFNEVGEFPYFCIPHPTMTGKIIVTEGAAAIDDISLETSLPLPFDRIANKELALRFTPSGDTFKGTDRSAIDHITYNIIITRDGEEIFNDSLHDHDGVLDLIIAPGEGEVIVKEEPSAFRISGSIFNENGEYTVKVEAVEVEFKPITPFSKEFNISVVPEFPLAVVLPMIIGFSAVLAILRLRNGISLH